MGEIHTSQTSEAIAPTVINPHSRDIDSLLGSEYLRTNRLGAYSSSTVIGCNTRRYHGLLVAAANPPVGRILGLSTVMEQLIIGERTYDLATNEFDGTLSPHGWGRLEQFRDEAAATFVYGVEGAALTKHVLLSPSANAVTIRYELAGPASLLLLRPFTALRDFHALRSADQQTLFESEVTANSVVVRDRAQPIPPLYLRGRHIRFRGDPQWWYRVLYRIDLARGQEAREDIYSPGLFVWQPGGQNQNICEITASLGEPVEMDFQADVAKLRRKHLRLLGNLSKTSSRPVRRLALAADAFIVRRQAAGQRGASILAGFPWFADWGRDTFIALPGLLLCTGRLALAKRVFRTYAASLSEGMIPNRFDDRTTAPHYNSIDASLWFIIAAERYLSAGGDQGFWRDVLVPACGTILEHYTRGTRFGIHAADDTLLAGGSPRTQLTWMDTKIGDEPITARYGKAVEVNALWYSAHRILAERCRGLDDALAESCAARAEEIADAFMKTFWNDRAGWLNDVVNDDGADASLRANQIFAVSLPHSPLPIAQQRAVMRAVSKTLLTPFGLRSLAPADARYLGRYGPGAEDRERAYHQGTVWPWLIGAFIEAYLKVENATGGKNPLAVAQAKQWLSAFDGHIERAGVGFISEIFDGDRPHAPHGCFAQAWSVAEILRAKMLVEKCEGNCG